MNIHFISGLPRSGSTLLAAILRQNPRFHAAMTSPLAQMYKALEKSMSRRNECASFINLEQRRAVLRGMFRNYYEESHGVILNGSVFFDTSRAWTTKLSALVQLFPNSRFICCVRDVSWIMDSVERLIRKNAFELSGIFGFNPDMTVVDRVNKLASPDGMVGYALDGLKEAWYGDHKGRLIIVSYDTLARDPLNTMAMVYGMLGEPMFDHCFDNVEYHADEFDRSLGTPGLHTVRKKVEFTERKTILPPELFKRFEKDCFWRSPQ